MAPASSGGAAAAAHAAAAAPAPSKSPLGVGVGLVGVHVGPTYADDAGRLAAAFLGIFELLRDPGGNISPRQLQALGGRLASAQGDLEPIARRVMDARPLPPGSRNVSWADWL